VIVVAMASPVLRPKRERFVNQRSRNESVALRLAGAERPEKIFPILVEEMVSLGFPRAAVLDVDSCTGEIKPVASLNCDSSFLQRLRISLWASENPLVSALQNLKPVLLPDGKLRSGALYLFPMIFRNDVRCWEAERERQSDCLAVQNMDSKRKLQLQQQVCAVCGIRSYIRVALGQMGRLTSESQLRQFRNLTERANRHLSRLFKVEHYCNRMRELETTVSNLAKLRAAEEVLRQDRDRLHLVIENVGDPIVVADNSAKIVLLDPLAKELFGSTAASRDPQIVTNDAKLDAYLTAFTFSFVDRQNKALQLYSPASHSQIEYAARSGKIYDSRGQVVYTVTVLRDFSTWRKLEQLQVERRMLEMEKFAATGKLAGAIAHEINNPMEAIKNAIYLLKNRVDADAQPIYDALKSETERVTRIVRQMLGLHRNAGQLGSFDLNGIVEDTLALFSRPLAKTGIAVDRRLQELPAMKGSADQFRQLLSNLVVNSQDSMPEGGRLTIKTAYTKSTRGAYGQISVLVADSGCGIPPEIRGTMFDPFVSTKGEKGTGLGLWIVQGIVENHSGRIQTRSRVGKGTIFKLIFPHSQA
jgi:signal transduction histidine kinase